jgi:hypothetical protein
VQGRTVKLGLLSAAGALAVLATGCFAPAPGGSSSLSVGPNPVSFPDSSQAAGFPMPSQVVTVTNTTGHPVGSVVVHPVGIYSIPSSNCSSLAAGQSCTATVLFCPNAVTSYNLQLSVTGQDMTTGGAVSGTTNLQGRGVP